MGGSIRPSLRRPVTASPKPAATEPGITFGDAMMDIGSTAWVDLLASGASELGIVLEDRHIRQFETFVRDLLFWNRRINLTRIVSPRDIAVKHLLDSLSPAGLLKNAGSLIDIGTGPGFPGIPLKIVRPDLELWLADTSRKRLNFLRQVVRTLALEGVRFHHGPAEALMREAAFRHRFDAVVSRAFGTIDGLYDIGAPLVRVGGLLIAMKGEGGREEMERFRSRAVSRNLACRMTAMEFTLPYSAYRRCLVVITTGTGETGVLSGRGETSTDGPGPASG